MHFRESIRYTISSLRIDDIPEKSGVYIFLNKAEKPVYIGKAKQLQSRIRQYISGHDERATVPFIVDEAVWIEIIVTNSEKEALILENNFIKEYLPKYNINLKDDKTYPYIALTDEEFPALIITRNPGRKYRYIKGPFTDSGLAHRLGELLQQVFPLKKCQQHCHKPCINFQMGLCPAPYAGQISKEDYEKRINHIIALLDGKYWRDFSKIIESEIGKSAELLQFERAGDLRDLLDIIPEIKTKLSVEFSRKNRDDFFLFSFYKRVAFITMARYLEGKLHTFKNFSVDITLEDTESIILNSLISFYKFDTLPEKIGIIPEAAIDTPTIPLIFGNDVKKTVIPPHIVDFLLENQSFSIEIYLRSEEEQNLLLKELALFLGIIPYSIMCIDVSTFYGEHNVVGAIWWEKGRFFKKNYRRFKVKTISGQNDFGSLAEIAGRLKKHWENNEWPKPDLLLIDGGKGQLGAVFPVLNEYQPIAGIVKDRKNTRGFEKLINMAGDELVLDDSPLALLMKKIRDEAHRFSVEYNRKIRTGKIETVIATIKGVGIKREMALLEFFKTIENLKKASFDEIAAVKGMTKKSAEAVFKFIHKSG